jgi:hypothetical protein
MFCGLIMRQEPVRAVDEETRIAATHPDCIDNTRVDYSWDGLVFPKRLRQTSNIVDLTQ